MKVRNRRKALVVGAGIFPQTIGLAASGAVREKGDVREAPVDRVLAAEMTMP